MASSSAYCTSLSQYLLEYCTTRTVLKKEERKRQSRYHHLQSRLYHKPTRTHATKGAPRTSHRSSSYLFPFTLLLHPGRPSISCRFTRSDDCFCSLFFFFFLLFTYRGKESKLCCSPAKKIGFYYYLRTGPPPRSEDVGEQRCSG